MLYFYYSYSTRGESTINIDFNDNKLVSIVDLFPNALY